MAVKTRSVVEIARSVPDCSRYSEPPESSL